MNRPALLTHAGDHLSRGCRLAGLFFVVAVVLMASAPGFGPVRKSVRSFLNVAGSVDATTAGVLIALALRRARTLLIIEQTIAGIVAGAIIFLPAPRSPPSSQSACPR